MADVKWIKFMVGTFDGKSFRQIKRAKLGDNSTPYRDKLTAVWFELLDLAAKYNNEGRLIKCDELAIDAEAQYEDIAIMVDREPEEIACCLQWYESHGMIEIVDNVYSLSNWSKYQTLEGIDKVREQGKLRQQRHREKLKLEGECNDSNVTSRYITEKNKNKKENRIDIEEDKDIDNNLIPACADSEEQIIFDNWNSQDSLIHHKELTQVRIKAIRKALKTYKYEEICQAIKNYNLILESEWYFDYKWSLEDFLNRKNGLPTFTDEGSNWVSFQEDVKNNPRLLPKELQPKQEKHERPSFLDDFMNKI